MPYISNKKRESLIKKINKSYGFRKFLITFEIVLLIGFIIVAFVSFQKAAEGNEVWYWFNKPTDLTSGFKPLGYGMLAVAIVLIVLAIISLILVWTTKSPKAVQEEVNELEAAPLSGIKINKKDTAGETMEKRKTIKKVRKSKK